MTQIKVIKKEHRGAEVYRVGTSVSSDPAKFDKVVVAKTVKNWVAVWKLQKQEELRQARAFGISSHGVKDGERQPERRP